MFIEHWGIIRTNLQCKKESLGYLEEWKGTFLNILKCIEIITLK